MVWREHYGLPVLAAVFDLLRLQRVIDNLVFLENLEVRSDVTDLVQNWILGVVWEEDYVWGFGKDDFFDFNLFP